MVKYTKKELAAVLAYLETEEGKKTVKSIKDKVKSKAKAKAKAKPKPKPKPKKTALKATKSITTKAKAAKTVSSKTTKSKLNNEELAYRGKQLKEKIRQGLTTKEIQDSWKGTKYGVRREVLLAEVRIINEANKKRFIKDIRETKSIRKEVKYIIIEEFKKKYAKKNKSEANIFIGYYYNQDSVPIYMPTQ